MNPILRQFILDLESAMFWPPISWNARNSRTYKRINGWEDCQ